MKHRTTLKNVPKVMHELSDVDVQLPLHQKALRQRLLKAHAAHTTSQPGLVTTLKTKFDLMRTAMNSKKVILVGAGIVVMTILILGFLMLSPAVGYSPSQKLIADTFEGVKEIKPTETTKVNKECEDLGVCQKNPQNPQTSNHTPQIASAAPAVTIPQAGTAVVNGGNTMTPETAQPQPAPSNTDNTSSPAATADPDKTVYVSINVDITTNDKQEAKALKKALKQEEKALKKALKNATSILQ